MINLDQVEKLRQYANISFEEAKVALEEADGDILEAIVKLEREDRIQPPKGGSYYYSSQEQDPQQGAGGENSPANHERGSSLAELVGRLFKGLGKLIKRGNENSFEIKNKDEKLMEFPVTILILLLVAAFWVTIPLLIIGLFFGLSYNLKGPDLGKENINKAMDNVADAAENLKNEFKGD